MFKYHCLNPISAVGMNKLDENYVKTENADEADVILVRSAKMHEMEFGKNLKAIARAGAGVNNIPLDKCAEEGIVVFNIPSGYRTWYRRRRSACRFWRRCNIPYSVNWQYSPGSNRQPESWRG